MKTSLAVLGLLLLAQDGDELKPGLVAEFYDLGGALEDFPSLPADRKPNLRRVDAQVDVESTEGGFGGTAMTDGFYVRWTGLVRVSTPGKYVFFTESDDGSRLFVGGALVVDNGGLHAMEERSGELELKAGDHAVRLEMFENGGSAGCRFSWEGPGIAKEIVPSKVLFHRKDADLDK
jgi:hypothetical protein